MPKTSRQIPSGDAPQSSSPFRYTAVVFGTGEVREIVEWIGNRQIRTIGPRGREGRALLAGGRVHLWCDSRPHADRLPVAEFLEALEGDVRREWKDHEGDDVWDRHCATRLKNIERWRTFYQSGPQENH